MHTAMHIHSHTPRARTLTPWWTKPVDLVASKVTLETREGFRVSCGLQLPHRSFLGQHLGTDQAVYYSSSQAGLLPLGQALWLVVMGGGWERWPRGHAPEVCPSHRDSSCWGLELVLGVLATVMAITCSLLERTCE